VSDHTSRPTVVLSLSDLLSYLRHPIALFVLGILISVFAFNTGLQYARHHVEVNTIYQNFAYIEIAGEEHVYQLDWYAD